MGRKLFHSAAWLSLFLWVLAAWGCLRSRGWSDLFQYSNQSGTEQWRVQTFRGGLIVERVASPSLEPNSTSTYRAWNLHYSGFELRADAPKDPWIPPWWKPGRWDRRINPPYRQDLVAINAWPPLALLIVLPALRGWGIGRGLRSALHRARRRKRGQCAFCGYDLRATPDRCPECGATNMQG